MNEPTAFGKEPEMDQRLTWQDTKQALVWGLGALVLGAALVTTVILVMQERGAQEQVRQAAEEMKKNCKYVGYTNAAVPDRIFSCEGRLVSEKQIVEEVRKRAAG